METNKFAKEVNAELLKNGVQPINEESINRTIYENPHLQNSGAVSYAQQYALLMDDDD